MRFLVPGLAALALSPGGLAFAETAGEPPRLRPLRSLARPWVLPRDTSLIRPPAVHPVAAPVDYGEGGALFGADRGGRMHEGQDVFAPAGTPLVAVRDGVVTETGNDGGRGNYLAIWSAQARETYVYLHLLEPPPVRAGERVEAGDHVGRLGCTGSCFGDHLHFEVRRGKSLDASPRNPLPLLRRWPKWHPS
jgi:murein DD-endopeptidase MepM/ murein hydrolase activator NlpD